MKDGLSDEEPETLVHALSLFGPGASVDKVQVALLILENILGNGAQMIVHMVIGGQTGSATRHGGRGGLVELG